MRLIFVALLPAAAGIVVSPLAMHRRHSWLVGIAKEGRTPPPLPAHDARVRDAYTLVARTVGTPAR